MCYTVKYLVKGLVFLRPFELRSAFHWTGFNVPFEGGLKNKKNSPDRLEMNKYCRFCKKHTLHRETK